MGGGKGGQSNPYQGDLMKMMMGSMANTAARSQPGMASMFQPGGSLGGTYSNLFPGQKAPDYQAPKTIDPTAGSVYHNAASQMGLGAPKAAPNPNYTVNSNLASLSTQGNPQKPSGKDGASSKVYMKGAGAMSQVPNGQPAPATSGNIGLGAGAPAPGAYQFKAPSFAPPAYQNVNVQTPQTQAITPLNVPQEQYKLAQNQATQQIAQGSKMAQQDLMRQYAARGLGRSGLQLQGAANLYNQGAGQQMANSANTIAQQNLAQQYGANQQAQQLEAGRQLGQGQLGLGAQGQQLQQALGAAGLGAQNAQFGAGQDLATQVAQAGQNLGTSQLGLQSLIGQGQLGLGQQAQNLSSIIQPGQLNMQQALGLGQLGLGEKQLGLSELGQQNAAQNFLGPILANLGGSIMGAQAGQGGKK